MDTELGKMNLWDKVLTAALNTGKDIDTALAHAEKAVEAFENRFESDIKKAVEKIEGNLSSTATDSQGPKDVQHDANHT